MADKRPHSKHATTSHMEPYTGSDPSTAGDRRGLAQFEKQRPKDADYGSSRGGPSRGGAVKGNQRWGGGGSSESSSGPPRALQPKAQPVKEREDDDLRVDRMRARFNEDEDADDGMVAVSATSWGEMDAPSADRVAAARRRGRQPEPEEEEVEYEEEEEVAPKKKATKKKKKGSNKGIWIGLSMLVLGGGGAAAAIIVSNNEAAAKAKADADAEAQKKADEAVAAKKKKDAEEEEERKESERRMQEEIDRKAKEAAAKLDAPKPVVTGPAEWAPNVEATNPWVSMPAAGEGAIIGISTDEATNATAALRTGFRPAAAVAAPTKGYKISQHEITWAEINRATNIPELVTMTKPTWFPKNPVNADDIPATNVPWDVAQKFCQGMGGDLPSEAEWEWAARGPEKRPFPWGTGAIEDKKVRIFAAKPIPVAPVKTQKLDVTPAQIYDLLGNAQEWTRDAWSPSEPGQPEDPKAKTHKALRGWPLVDKGQSIPAEGSSYRAPGCASSSCASESLERVGFRCTKPE